MISCLTRWVERASCPWCGTGILPVVWNGHLARGVERASCPLQLAANWNNSE
ncbi:MAG: hypothetical protein F6K26_35860 [Moorea sp. SIO2I5]|nr:hypothetical protein [Moorena sp. SIO2I5]